MTMKTPNAKKWVQGEYDGTDIYKDDRKKVLIAKVVKEADAALIVTAVNAHSELLQAAKALLADAQDREETTDDDGKEYADYKALRVAIEKRRKIT